MDNDKGPSKLAPVNSSDFPGFAPGTLRCDSIKCNRVSWYQRLWRRVTKRAPLPMTVTMAFTYQAKGGEG